MAEVDNGERLEKKKIPAVEGYIHFPESPSEKPYLVGSKCTLCGLVSFPRRVVCPACVNGETMQEIPLSGKGKLESFSIAHVAPPGFTAPYILAWVNLAEGPRIFTQMTGCEPEENSLEIGMDVDCIIDTIAVDESGNELIGYKFYPVRKKD